MASGYVGIYKHSHLGYVIIEASLSEPHTSVTSLHPCTCVNLLTCLFAWTDHLLYVKSLPALILHILRHVLNLRTTVEDINHGQSSCSMAMTRTKTTHKLPIQWPRVIGITAW